MLKEECQNLNIKVTKSYTDLDQLINDIEDESITNIPIIVWGHISDYPGLEQSRLIVTHTLIRFPMFKV